MAFYSNAPLPDTNARQVAQTIRMPSTALLTIDSEDRYVDYAQARATPTSPYNFAISKNESLMPGFMTRIGISEVVFPWAIPNINAKTSQIQINYQAAGAPDPSSAIVSLLPGFLTPSELAAALQADIRVLNGALSSFTMTYGGSTNCIFVYSSGNLNTSVSFSPMTPNSIAYPYSAQSKQLFDILGFTNANTVMITQGSPKNGAPTFCQAIRYVDIVCNQLTNSQAQKDQTSQPVARDMLCRVYLGDGGGTGQSTIAPGDALFCPPGCAPMTIYRNFATPKQIQWIPNQNIPGFLQFQVYDDTGDLLDNSLPASNVITNYTAATLDWSMTMLVSEN